MREQLRRTWALWMLALAVCLALGCGRSELLQVLPDAALEVEEEA